MGRIAANSQLSLPLILPTRCLHRSHNKAVGFSSFFFFFHWDAYFCCLPEFQFPAGFILPTYIPVPKCFLIQKWPHFRSRCTVLLCFFTDVGERINTKSSELKGLNNDSRLLYKATNKITAKEGFICKPEDPAALFPSYTLHFPHKSHLPPWSLRPRCSGQAGSALRHLGHGCVHPSVHLSIWRQGTGLQAEPWTTWGLPWSALLFRKAPVLAQQGTQLQEHGQGSGLSMGFYFLCRQNREGKSRERERRQPPNLTKLIRLCPATLFWYAQRKSIVSCYFHTKHPQPNGHTWYTK